MKDNHICQVFLHFSKTFLPNNFSSLSRFGSDANEFFNALLSLGDSEIETTKIRTALRNLKREFKEPISVVLLKIDSLYTALYQMSQPNKSEQDIIDLTLKHELYLIGGFISSQSLKLLMIYSRERAMKNRQLTLEEIVTFLNRVEQNVNEAALQNIVNMPRRGKLLDTIQAGAHTLNAFQQLDSDTVHGVFVGSYNSFHNNQTKRNFSYNKMVFLSLTDIEITNEAFLRLQIIGEEHLVDFPRDHLSQVLPETFPPNEVTTALEGKASVSNNTKEDQY